MPDEAGRLIDEARARLEAGRGEAGRTPVRISRSLLEFSLTCTSQYDATFRGMAAEILQLRDAHEELVAALRGLADAVRIHTDHDSWGAFLPAWEVATAALSKAEGGTP